MSQHVDKEGFLPSSQDPRGAGEHIQSCTFLHHGFQEWIWKVCMAQELQQYTAFTVGNLGFYEFTRMPFGLCNVPATFQCLRQNTLGELNLTYCIIYLDDVIDIWVYRRRTSRASMGSVWVLQRIQPKIETLQVLLLPDKDSVPCTSCLQIKNSPEWGKCVCHYWVSHARNLYWSKSVLWIVRSLSATSSKSLHVWLVHCMIF